MDNGEDQQKGGKAFDFWQDHSNEYLEMAFCNDYREVVHNPDGYGKRTGECGDTVEFYLTVTENKLEYIAFESNGCLNTNACANTVAHLSKGKSVDSAWDIKPEDILEYLKTVPEHEHHCAELSVGAFYLALSDCKNENDKKD
jgi:nitrogen fixation NifU-like protein